jgi:hypothetical protein
MEVLIGEKKRTMKGCIPCEPGRFRRREPNRRRRGRRGASSPQPPWGTASSSLISYTARKWPGALYSAGSPEQLFALPCSLVTAFKPGVPLVPHSAQHEIYSCLPIWFNSVAHTKNRELFRNHLRKHTLSKQFRNNVFKFFNWESAKRESYKFVA